MAIRSVTTYPDLLGEYLKGGSNSTEVETIELMTQANTLLLDANVLKCNRGMSHLINIRSGLPTSFWTKYYEGIQPTAGTTISQLEGTAMLQSSSIIDEDLLRASENPNKERMTEAISHLEDMGQEVCRSIFYGNRDANSSQFNGFAPRFNELSGSANSGQVVDAGGVGFDNTSIWFVTWGDRQSSIIYPGSTMAGIARKDHGSQRVEGVMDANGMRGSFYGQEERFTWQAGLAVADWRYVVRICNIDVSLLQSGNVPLYKFLNRAFYKHRSSVSPKGHTSIYCNQQVKEALDLQSTNQGANDNFIRLRQGEDIQGKMVDTYKGYPVKIAEALLNTEARVT